LVHVGSPYSLSPRADTPPFERHAHRLKLKTFNITQKADYKFGYSNNYLN